MTKERKDNGDHKRQPISRRKLLASIGVAGAAAVLGAAAITVNQGANDGVTADGKKGSVLGAGLGVVTTIEGLKAMPSPDPAHVYYVADRGKEGHFRYDPDDLLSKDNTGTVVVAALGARFKRVMETEYTSVTWFGAEGDGKSDDFAAIQRAIDAVSAAGGGTVFFPAGTYIVSPSLNKWIKLRNKVNLLGEGASSVIKVKDNAGDYFAIFYGSTSEPLRDVRISNLKFDQNPQNNTSCNIDLERKDTSYYCQFCIISYRYDNVVVDNVQFDPTCGVNSVSLNSDTGSMAAVTNCYFNFVMAKGSGTYDNSAVYLNGRNHLVANNMFFAAPGQKARGAIETHLGQSVVANNVVDGYYTGVNLQAGSGEGDRCDMTITGNTISNANQGIQIGPYKTFPVQNVTITGNTISLANTLHKRYLTTGITNAGWTNDPTFFENITVTGNTIVFQEELEYRSEMPSTACGIGFTHNSDLHNVLIGGNTIVNPPVTGIHIGSLQKERAVTNVQIVDNIIVNPGHYPSPSESLRAGILLRSDVTGARIAGNLISDRYDAARGVHSIRASDADGTFADVEVAGNLVQVKQGGLWMLLSPSIRTDEERNRTKYVPRFPPAAGTFGKGDIVWVTGEGGEDGKQPAGYKVTAAGTAGKLSGVQATFALGSFVLSVNDASSLRTGQWIRIAAGNQIRQIVRISGQEVRVAEALTAGASEPSPVTYAAPQWKPFGRLGSLEALGDTSGATLSELEGEVNRLKEALRDYGIVSR